MKILFYEFSPETLVPTEIVKFNSWWKKEIRENPEAVAVSYEIEENEVDGYIHEDNNVNQVLRVYSGLKRAYNWLMKRL